MSHRHKVVALSKLVAYILRHRPDEFGLVLDKDGFIPLKELQQAITEEKEWAYVRRRDIMEVVYTDERNRFEIQDEKVRAAYGHSVAPKISYEAFSPPKILFHGTRRRSYPHILKHGLNPMGRQYVHLTTEPQLALRIGHRRDPEPVLLHIHAHRAFEDGVAFYRASPLIFLADHLPATYISGPPASSVVPEPKQASQHESATTVVDRPGSVLLDLKMQPAHRREKRKTWKERSRRHRRRKGHF